MRRIYIITGILLWFTMSILDVHAGSLNEYESAVVSVARGQFEYNGVQYRAADGYVSELISYLSSDDVDLTAAQRDEAISTIYANVEQGVVEGYIVPINTDNTKPQNPESQEPQESQEQETNPDSDTENQTTEPHQEPQQPAITTNIDQKAGKITVTDKEDQNILTVNTVIKNTGFNLNTTIIIATGLAIIMIACIIVTYQQQLFAQNDE